MNAADLLLTLVVVAVAATAAVALVRALRRDGLGHRSPPRSHRDWWEGTPLGRRQPR